MARKIILIAGLPGAGKSILSSFLQEAGLKVFNMGDIIRDLAVKHGVEKTQENLLKIAESVRREYGPGGVAKLMLPLIEKENDIVVVDGVRSISEIKEFRNVADCIKVVAVHASPINRFKRILKRNRPGDPKNFEDFLKRDVKELGFGIGNVIALSDLLLVNEGSIEDFVRTITAYKEEILKCEKESAWKYL